MIFSRIMAGRADLADLVTDTIVQLHEANFTHGFDGRNNLIIHQSTPS
jgi:hypothetical protein